MKIIVCVDNNNGMMFNHRRQSQDKILREKILKLSEGTKLWMNAYSQKQFLSDMPGDVEEGNSEEHGKSGQLFDVLVNEDFLDKAGVGEYCFVEDADISPYEKRIEEVIICRWNRDYPADMYLGLDMGNYRLVETNEFPGSSHDKITMERYVKR